MKTKTLECGCCGAYFRTWSEYTDQGQDKGYGTCRDCQGWQARKTNAELDRLAIKIRTALNPRNQTKFDAMSEETKRHIALMAIEDGLVSYSIGAKP